jgi:hypothetical protein
MELCVSYHLHYLLHNYGLDYHFLYALSLPKQESLYYEIDLTYGERSLTG